MATFKAVILNYLSQTDKAYSVRIRVTHNRRVAYIRTKYRVSKDKVTQKGNIKSDVINKGLITNIKFLTDKVYEMRRNIDNYTARELADYLEKYLDTKDGVHKDYVDFIAYGELLAKTMKAKGQKGQGQNYLTTLRTIQIFTENETLNISEITTRWLRKFEEWLLSQPSRSHIKKNAKIKDVKNISNTGVAFYMRCIRAIFNKACDEFNDEDRDEIVIAHYPFSKYVVPAEEIPPKRALSVETIRAIRDYIPAGKRSDKRAVLARDVFMLSFYLMGMNLADLYVCAEIEKKEVTVDSKSSIQKRLIYNRSKTCDKRQDNAEMSVLLVTEATEFLKRYSDSTKTRIFNFYKLYASADNFTAAVNKGLKTIGKNSNVNVPNLTLYAARHSFATIARNDCGASIDEVAACLNHSIPGFGVTDKYLKRDWAQVDKVQRAVLELVAKE